MYHLDTSRRPALCREVPPTEQPRASWAAPDRLPREPQPNPTVSAMLGVIASEARGEPAPRGGLFHIL